MDFGANRRENVQAILDDGSRASADRAGAGAAEGDDPLRAVASTGVWMAVTGKVFG